MNKLKHVCVVAVLGLALNSTAQVTMETSGSWAPIGVSWPTFSCSFSCNGVTTTVPGTVSVNKLSAPGVLTAVQAELEIAVGGAWGGTITGQDRTTAATGHVTGTVRITLPGGAMLQAAADGVGTVNTGGASVFGIPLNPGFGTGGPVAIPSVYWPLFQGQGTTTLQLVGSFLQRVYPSRGTCTGAFSLGGGTTYARIKVRYEYHPPLQTLAGGTAGANGPLTLAYAGMTVANSPISCAVGNAVGGSVVLLGVSVAPVPVPAFGGILHCSPLDGFVSGITDGGGSYSHSFPWPGFVSGQQAAFQFLCLDPGVPFGVAMSDGILATTL